LFGYGVVGTGLYDVLHKSKTVDATIKKIVVKHKDKPRNISPEHFHFDKNEILNDDEINGGRIDRRCRRSLRNCNNGT
jgi:homoserine dehydrogenase